AGFHRSPEATCAFIQERLEDSKLCCDSLYHRVLHSVDHNRLSWEMVKLFWRASQSRRDSLDSACRILGTLQTRLVEGCERRLGHRLGLLFVVRRLGHITGQDDLTRPIYTCLGIATVVPALVVGPHDMQLGIRKVALGLVVGAVLQRFRSLAAPFLPRPLALRLSVGSALTLGLRF